MANKRGKKQRRRDSDRGVIVLWFGKHQGRRLCDISMSSLTEALSDHIYRSPEWWVFQGELKRRQRLHELAVDYAAITDRGNGRKRTGSKAVVRRKADELRASIGFNVEGEKAGQPSPWGVPYPESWGLMSIRERRQWKVNASAKFGETPLGQKIVEVKKPAKHTPVKPAIPVDAADESIAAQKFANVALAKKHNGESVTINPDECPY